MTPTSLRAAVYARYSTDLQNPNSVRDQIASCRALAHAKGWRGGGGICRRGDVGHPLGPTDFMRLSVDLATGRFDLVLAESLDRISRSMKETAEFYALPNFHGMPRGNRR